MLIPEYFDKRGIEVKNRVCNLNIFGTGRIAIIGLSVAASALLAVGCGSSDDNRTTIAINKDGSVQSTIYESFDKDYYDISELSDMASDEISYYNSEYISPKIILEEPELINDGKMAKLVMNYDSSDDYSHFNQVSLFYGTVQEAIDKGYSVTDNLVDPDGNKAEAFDLEEELSHHIIITDEKVYIIAPYKISYSTLGVTITDKKEADLSNATKDSIQLLLSK